MKQHSMASSKPRPSRERRRLLREYFFNALALALMKEAGALAAAAPASAPAGTPRFGRVARPG